MASIVTINAVVSCCGLVATRLPHQIRAKLVVALWKMFENKTIRSFTAQPVTVHTEIKGLV